ncbi:MAG: FtsX-like permease family protein [Firmicutes bacterium]|jgi:putative ABC transport system permease protein|nr:ABC transporter permease [Bacillota bacterium]NLL08611.1 FtsX-like permease family protein [Bacillota bacterium]
MDTLRFTWRIIRKRPLRSLLTVLQVALGVWIVAVILSLNFGASGSIDSANRAFGDSLAKISVSRYQEFDGEMLMVGSTSNLRYEDMVRVLESEYVEQAFILEERWMTSIIVDGNVYTVQTQAEVTSDYAEAVGLEIVEGQFFTKADEEQKSRVVLVSDVVAKQLWPNQSALGKVIDLGDFGEGNMEFEVIGVYKLLPPLVESFITRAHLLFPLGSTTVWVSLDDYEPHYMNIFVKAKPGRIYEAVEDARTLLADRALDNMEVNGEYLQDSNRYLTEQLKTITLFLGAFAFIAVLVSAIGILSIMLVSVVERTREIGLRQALGASKRIIVGQILNESLVFSAAGSVLGLIAAYFTAPALISTILEEAIYTSLSDVGGLHPHAAALALLVAVVMGQLFGLYPAWQAAKMAPVDALREG